MKKNLTIALALLIMAMLATVSCNNRNSSNNMEIQVNEENTVFPKGEPNNSSYFTGEAYLYPIVDREQTDGYYSAGSVTFMPGARTYWHTHPSVQVLVVTEGRGWYQERGKEAVKLQKGSVIPIPVDVEHWHGAAADAKLVHIHITNYKDDGLVTWMNPVTDEQYARLK